MPQKKDSQTSKLKTTELKRDSQKPRMKLIKPTPRSSLLSLILFPLLVVIIVSVILGGTLFPSLVVKEAEDKDHERIESIEEIIFEFIGGESRQIYNQSYLISIKEKTDLDISLYNKEGVIVSSIIDSDDSLRINAPFDPKFVDDLLKRNLEEEIPHIHKHFTIGNDLYMISYYPLPIQIAESPILVAFTSSVSSFYELRNRISLIVALGIALILGGIALFLIFILGKYISRPVKALIGVVQKVGEGNLKVSVPRVLYGEIGDLTEHFSVMINKLREAKEKEEEVSRMKTEILSIASHHLRTPLSGLKWSLRMILDEEVGKIASSEQKDMLEKAYDSNERMIELVNDLLDVTRIEEGRFGYTWAYGQVEDVIDEVIEESKPRMKKTGLEFFYFKPEKPLPKIKMDPSKIRLAVSNLLDNAIKYTPGGKIKISLSYKDLKVIFHIEDTGIGIPKIEQPKLFTKFFRASNAIMLQTHGTGLGLFIVKSIVEKHGGKIWFKSEEGKGSTFSFSSPVEKRFAPREKYAEFLENI